MEQKAPKPIPILQPEIPAHSSHQRVSKRTYVTIAIAVVLAAMMVVAYFLLRANAATMQASVEAESGTINSLTVKVADASASGMQAIRLGAVPGTQTPTPPTPTPPTPTPPAPTPPPTPPTTGDPKPVGVAGNWSLKFGDDFNGSSLDLTKWFMCNPSFRAMCLPWNNERQIYNTATTNNANVKVSGGNLQLIATRDPNGQIRSGMVSTGPIPAKFNYSQPGYTPFQFTYGYYEGRVKIPKGNGFWPSMWMLPDQDRLGAWPGSGEYDVFEIPGNNPREYHFTAHWGGNGGACGHPCTPQQATITDASANYHVFGFDWQPSGLTWYVDGKKMGYTVTDRGAIKSHPFYIIANFSVGGTWGPLNGAPDASTPFPATYSIDYLRVWQRQ